MKIMRRVILHLDMDAFFAAVEQLDFPQHRGKPVVVGADPKGGRGRGVVSTCSYEAREFGIHSAMPISQAYKRCPHAVYLPPRGKRYSELSKKIMKILREYSPLVEQISIDEAFLDLTGTEKVRGVPREVALKIKQRIKKEIGLTASVGIAPNKFVAKIASDLEKPDGLVIVREGEIKTFLDPLKISRLWGIGKKTEPKFREMGINTIGDLSRFSREELSTKFGKHGRHLWNLSHGIDKRAVEPYEEAKSVSNEITFENDTCDERVVNRTLLHLSDKVARRLRKDNLCGRTVTLKIRLEDFSTFTRSRTLADPVDSSETIRSVTQELFDQFDCRGLKVRLLGVGVSGITDSSGIQLSFFQEEQAEKEKIDKVMDTVREKFGEKAIARASLLRKGKKRQK